AALNRPLSIVLILVKTVQQLIYYFLSRKTLMGYQRSIRHLYSETSRIDLRWTRYLVNGFILLVSVFILIFPLMIRYTEHFSLLLFINMAIATPYIYIAAYKGILQPAIWQIQPDVNKKIVEKEIREVAGLGTESNSVSEREERIRLNAEKINELTRKITVLM